MEDNVTYGIETWFEESKTESRKLAEIIQVNIAEATLGKDRGTRSQHSLYVTKNTNAPAVLIECGFISSDYEGELLTNESYQEKIASGIVEGIVEYFSH